MAKMCICFSVKIKVKKRIHENISLGRKVTVIFFKINKKIAAGKGYEDPTDTIISKGFYFFVTNIENTLTK